MKKAIIICALFPLMVNCGRSDKTEPQVNPETLSLEIIKASCEDGFLLHNSECIEADYTQRSDNALFYCDGFYGTACRLDEERIVLAENNADQLVKFTFTYDFACAPGEGFSSLKVFPDGDENVRGVNLKFGEKAVVSIYGRGNLTLIDEKPESSLNKTFYAGCELTIEDVISEAVQG